RQAGGSGLPASARAANGEGAARPGRRPPRAARLVGVAAALTPRAYSRLAPILPVGPAPPSPLPREAIHSLLPALNRAPGCRLGGGSDEWPRVWVSGVGRPGPER